MRTSTILAVAALALFTGCRGGISKKPPVHLVLDMDFQQKLKAQSESTFPGWEDTRGMRLPVEGTIARGGIPAGAQPGDYYIQTPEQILASYDTDNDGVLGRLETKNLPIHHIRVFRLADRNDDGSLDIGEIRTISKIYQYKNDDGSHVTANPLPATAEVLARGRERYDIHCSVCHGRSGKGGPVAKRWPGYPQLPPDLVEHEDLATRRRLVQLPFGELFETITKGKGTMPGYAQQISVDDRWAIAHYLKALQAHFN